MDQLPHEVWLCVVWRLPSSSLCNLALTSRHFYATATDPSLWSKAKLTKTKPNAARLASFFQVSRFSKISCIDLSHMEVSTEQLSGFLSASLAATNLKQLDLTGVDLSNVSAGLLALALTRLCTLELGRSSLTQLQLTVFFSHMLTSTSLASITPTSTTLAHLNLSSVNLSRVDPPELVGLAVSNLTRLNLSFTSLKADQATNLLTNIKDSKTLVDVDLSGVYLVQVSEVVLSEGVRGLVKVNLEKTGLAADQCTAVFQQIVHSTTLEDVNLGEVRLTQVPADLLGKAVATLVKADLRETSLTREQFTSLMSHSLTSTTLEHLNVFHFEEKLPTPLPIPDGVISQAVSRLKSVNLGRAALSRLHATAIFKEIKSSTSLADLNLQDVNLSRVPCDLLAEAVCLLRSADLSLTKLTPQQLTALLTGVVSTRRMTSLRLVLVDLSQVAPELLAKAVARLESVALSKMTTVQSTALLTKLRDSPTPLQEVDFKNTNLSQVSPDLVGKVVSKMKVANLSICKLTTDQLNVLLQHAINSKNLQQIDLVGNNLSEVPVKLLTKALRTTNIQFSKHLAPVKMFNTQ